MNKNLLIFDIDDTVTKSEFQHQSSFIDAMKALGIHKINQNWSEYDHMTDTYILKCNFENNLDAEFNKEFISKFENKMMGFMTQLSEVSEIPGSTAFVEKIYNHDSYDYCFATGSLSNPALLKLKQAGIRHQEEIVVGSNDYLSREEIVDAAISRAKQFYNVVEYERIISFGDGLWDLKTAEKLGLHFVGLGEKHKEIFKQKGVKIMLLDWTNFKIEDLENAFGIN